MGRLQPPISRSSSGFFAASAYGWLSRGLGAVGVLIFLVGLFATLRDPVREWFGTAVLAVRQHGKSWNMGKLGRRSLLGAGAVVLLGALLPWPITLTGPFVAAPVLSIPLTAPDSGIVQRVQVVEGTRVAAGAPLLNIRNLELERELAASRRVSDSLAARSAQFRGQDNYPEVALIDANRSVEEARLAGLQRRVEALHIRALGEGIVVTTRPEELAGRWVSSGEVVLQLGQSDSVEIRIALNGAGGTLVRAGSKVRLLPEAIFEGPVSGRVAAVSSAASSSETVEARLQLPADHGWRPGMTGRASITLQQSNVWGALWWEVRRRIRSDILL